ncbi:MAG: hypothetical protein HY001_03295 [Candidatus Portnoybacteria bacterium]|nr:hypothetical protein [Candidatus Portnoybacteria bacterium]
MTRYTMHKKTAELGNVYDILVIFSFIFPIFSLLFYLLDFGPSKQLREAFSYYADNAPILSVMLVFIFPLAAFFIGILGSRQGKMRKTAVTLFIFGAFFLALPFFFLASAMFAYYVLGLTP